jgi:crossover junction endodeoxyribonuclease RusA
VITLTLPYPPSANRYWRTRVVTPRGGEPFVSTYVSSDAKAFKDAAGWMAKKAGVRSPLAGRIEIAFSLHPKLPQDWRLRARKDPDGWDDTVQCMDLDNANKVLLDALKGIVFEDDRWVRKITATRGEPLPDACLVVTVTQLAATQRKQTQEALL